MAVVEIAKIQVRRGQENVTGVPQLDPGEFGWAQDTQHLYIGKRISEGANNDENSRILTDLDLKNIFDILGGGLSGSAASTSTYRYRDNLEYSYFKSTTTTIAKKLDTTVYLSDFSQTTLSGDITGVLQTAINDIYANNYYGTATIRTLKIPAGKYSISGIIDLPPFVTLIGEGAGVTTLVLESSGTGMFRTVDKLGAHYGQSMQFDNRASKNVSLYDMTLAYSGHHTNSYPLLSLDNTINPKVSNVEFTTINTNTSFVQYGLGLAVQGSIGVDESTVICRDIEITNCKFSLLDKAITETGSVSRTVIDKNLFSNLNYGITVSTSTSTIIPTDLAISNNKFTFVYNEAVAVSTSSRYSRVTSAGNQYYYVGNRSSRPDQNTTATQKPILTLNAPGNVSLNDYFHRTDFPEASLSYFNPIANSNLKIVDGKVRQTSVALATTNVPIINIPLTAQEQLVVVEYQLSNSTMSRKGRLTMNISYDGFASVSDYYNFSETVDDESNKVVFSTDTTNSVTKNMVSITCSNFTSEDVNLEYSLEITV